MLKAKVKGIKYLKIIKFLETWRKAKKSHK